MMAKMFYTLEETKGALGMNEEEIKQLSREGRLREFRDGPRLMFKADQVDNLKSELAGSSDQISLGPSDSGAPIGLADSRTSPLSGSGISLADSGKSRTCRCSIAPESRRATSSRAASRGSMACWAINSGGKV